MYECEACNIIFKYEADQKRHVNEKHVIDVRVYCRHCNKGYSHKSHLIRHMNREHYEQEFPPIYRNRNEFEHPHNPHHNQDKRSGFQSEQFSDRARRTSSSRSSDWQQSYEAGPGQRQGQRGWRGEGDYNHDEHQLVIMIYTFIIMSHTLSMRYPFAIYAQSYP